MTLFIILFSIIFTLFCFGVLIDHDRIGFMDFGLGVVAAVFFPLLIVSLISAVVSFVEDGETNVTKTEYNFIEDKTIGLSSYPNYILKNFNGDIVKISCKTYSISEAEDYTIPTVVETTARLKKRWWHFAYIQSNDKELVVPKDTHIKYVNVEKKLQIEK